MRIHSIDSLPDPSTGAVEEPVIRSSGGDFELSLVLEGDSGLVACLFRFGGVRAFRRQSENLCTVWHLEGYDKLVEVIGSDWVRELKAEGRAEWRDYFPMRHFMVYLDSFGVLEVVGAEALLVVAPSV